MGNIRQWIWVLCLLLWACSRPQDPFVGTDITGVRFEHDLQLKDQTGVVRNIADFKGRVVVLFFGYTFCPDVCPTTLGDLALALKKMGQQANRVQVLFVTLDPERDTPARLRQYLSGIDSSFLGLSGDSAQIEAAARTFKIYHRKQILQSKIGYTIDHSAGLYVFDREGALRLYLNHGQKPQDIAHDLALLLKAA